MPTIGYVPFEETAGSREAGWLSDFLGVEVHIVTVAPAWNHSPPDPLPPIDRLVKAIQPLLVALLVVTFISLVPVSLLSFYQWALFAGSVVLLGWFNVHPGWVVLGATALGALRQVGGG
jgi:hypothetical protein